MWISRNLGVNGMIVLQSPALVDVRKGMSSLLLVQLEFHIEL